MKHVESHFPYYTIRTPDQVVADLETNSTTGLSSRQASERLRQFGSNALAGHETSLLNLLMRQFASPFIYVLLIVAAISFVVENHFDGAVILCIVILNTLIGFYQEYKADRALKILKGYLVAHVAVMRDGKKHIITPDGLVPGDIVVLYPGDKIPADVRFIQAHNVTVDESMLTGESVAVAKITDALAAPVNDYYMATNIGFSGTTMMRGKGLAVVFATGTSSALGTIASLTAATPRVSSFAKIINRFSGVILYVIVISIALVFVMNIIIKRGSIDIIELLLFSAALAVSVIPEGLPIVTTFALSQGALQLARQKTVVKRLSAIEDLGNIEILCSDKTGTLTENRMAVQEIYGNNERDAVFYMSLAGMLTNSKAETLKGFDAALWNALSLAERKKIEQFSAVIEFPFDPVRRLDSALIKSPTAYFIVVRGAVEFMLKRCVPTDNPDQLTAWIEQEGFKGRRVLGIALKEVNVENEKAYALAEQENGMRFVGAISFEDPLKDTAAPAIKKAHRFGIECKIISGDAREVCGAIAFQVGLVKDPRAVLTGAELEQHPESEQLELVHKYHVFARVSPEQKYKIIRLLQQTKEVGYMGDGINDAPALKEAGVGLAVQDASDIAREAADIILLERSLLVVINGIIEGRKIFANTLKYLRTTMAANFGNFYAIAIVSLFIDYLPMLPVQILLVNLLTDTPLLALATDNVGRERLERAGQQFDIKSIMLLAMLLGLVSTVFDFIFFAIFYKISPTVLQTGWFMGSILTELVFIFSIRTSRVVWKGSPPSSLLTCLIIGAALVSIILPQTVFGHEVFGFTALSFGNMLWIFALVIVYFFVSDTVKALYFARNNGKKV